MTTLRDPFAITHKKDIKNKAGQVVAQVDYVGWSQVADRLDEVEPGWSFIVIALGEDWCHGRLTFNDRTFENVGYAENADMDWKKEALKDAVSDAFKRCAALAGVARYLYDKDGPRGSSAPVQRPVETPRPSESTVPPEPEFMRELIEHPASVLHDAPERPQTPGDGGTCPVHGYAWKEGKRGFFCSGKTNGAWCDEHPTQKWVAGRAAGAR